MKRLTVNIPQIELRKRGVAPKETNVANQMGTQAERDRAKEGASLRREKRGGMRVSFLLLLSVLWVAGLEFHSTGGGPLGMEWHFIQD